MKEPYFIYTRRTQTIAIGEGKTVTVASFLQWAPDFKPPMGIDQLVYLPGVRASIHVDGTQSVIPDLARAADSTRWPNGDRYITVVQEMLTRR